MLKSGIGPAVRMYRHAACTAALLAGWIQRKCYFTRVEYFVCLPRHSSSICVFNTRKHITTLTSGVRCRLPVPSFGLASGRAGLLRVRQDPSRTLPHAW